MYTEAKVIEDTLCEDTRLTTLQVRYPRIILPEVNTHRIISKNTQSSRAKPVKKLIKELEDDNNCFVPLKWTRNKKGMSSNDSVSVENSVKADLAWFDLKEKAIAVAKELLSLGVHKQHANRVLEPFLYVNSVLTSDNWDHFLKLRLHHTAQPEIRELAHCIDAALKNSEPVKRNFHLPYVRDEDVKLVSNICTDKKCLNENSEEKFYLLLKLSKISAARCARVSYTPFDSDKVDISKDIGLAEKLLKPSDEPDAPKHMSPFDHPAIYRYYVKRSCRDTRQYKVMTPARVFFESDFFACKV